MEGNDETNTTGETRETSTTRETCCLDLFRLHAVTWNVGTADPPNDVTALLHLNSPKSPDLYVIGLQEVYAAPHRFLSDLAFDDAWSRLLSATLGGRGYLRVSSIRMQGLLLLFFSKMAHVPFIRDIQATHTRTGCFGYWGNKGAVSIRLSLYGHMLCFLNVHLLAHMDYAAQRVDELETILDTTHTLDHRLVVLLGDLNFRIQGHGMQFIRSCINSQRYKLLWSNDQLTMMKKKEPLLQQFEEGPLDFPPTYKFDRFSESYDSSGKKRKPAWTDRILWRVKPKAPPPEEGEEPKEGEEPGLEAEPQSAASEQGEEFPLRIRQDAYVSDMQYGISDHKPVIGLFTLELKKLCPSPLVRVWAEGQWSADMDAMVTYSPLHSFPSSAWDWIGLYQVGFSSVSDYITYTWVKDNQVSSNQELIQVYVSKEEIPVRGGECVLCYYSSALHCIIGISPPFKVQESKAALEEALVNGLDQMTHSS